MAMLVFFHSLPQPLLPPHHTEITRLRDCFRNNMFLNIIKMIAIYSTVTDLARFFGLSMSQPFSFAT